MPANASMDYVEGTCVCTFTKKLSTNRIVKTDVVSDTMKTNIFDPCLAKGMYGQWENNDWKIRFHNKGSA
jgi:hypothetical protein